MARELTTHPETGDLVEVVKNYQNVDLNSLKNEVDQHQTNLDSLSTQIDELTKSRDEASRALEDSKSDVSRAEELVGSPVAPELDAGTEAASGEVETANEDAEVPVHVETPSF